MDTHPFPVNMVELGDKNVLIRQSQTKYATNENIIIGEQHPERLLGKSIKPAKVASDGHASAGSFVVGEISQWLLKYLAIVDLSLLEQAHSYRWRWRES